MKKTRHSFMKYINLNWNASVDALLNVNAVLVSVYLTLMVLFLYNPTANTAVNSFKRIIGNGVLHGVDIERRISNFYLWYLIMGPLVFIVVYSAISLLYNKTKTANNDEVYSFINSASIIASLGIFAWYLSKLSGKAINILNYNYLFSLSVIALCLSFMVLNKFFVIRFRNLKRIIISGLPILVMTIYIFNKINKLEFIFALLYLAVVYITIYLINKLIKNNKSNNKKVNSIPIIIDDEMYSFLKSVSIAAASSIFLYVTLYVLYRNRFTDIKIDFLNYSIVVSLCLIVFCLFFKLIQKYLSITFNDFKWIIFISLPLVVSNLFLLKNISKYKIYFILFYFLIVILVTYLTDKLVKINILNDDRLNKLKISFTPFMYSLAIVSLFLEAVNILNQYNIFVTNKIIYSALIIVGFILLGFLLFAFGRFDLLKTFKWERLYYLGIILSLSLFNTQPNLQTQVFTDLFEGANHGLLISEFFKYGKIPLIETFDAHMMSNSIWGIIYGVLNKDTFGAIFVPYGGYITPIISLLFYMLIKECFDDNFALFMTLLIPFSLTVIYADFAYIAIFSLIYAVRKNNFFSYLIYWFSLVLICMYKLDTGFSFSVGTILALCTVLIIKREKLSLIKCANSLAVILASFFSVYFSICIVRGINGVSRLKEILFLAKSNVNWAYASLGETYIAGFPFAFCYIVIPFLTVSLIIMLVYLIKKDKVKIPTNVQIILFSLAFAYIANISRSMVRHSVYEMQLNMVLFTAVLFISITVATIKSKYKAGTFALVFLAIVVIAGLLRTGNYINNDNLFNASLNRISFGKLFDDNATEKVDRIVISKDMKDNYIGSVKMINDILTDDETYLDFTNQSLLYALADKEKPVYVNQSPGLLNGEFTQEQFIRQIEKNKEKVAFALMPAEGLQLVHILDDIPNPYRYYKVSEYISQNYKPLCKTDKYVLWCRNERYKEVYNSVFGNGTNDGQTTTQNKLKYTLCGYNYSDINGLHSYNLIQIPFIWGMYDEKKGYDNPVINNVIKKYNDYYTIETKNISKEKGNYILLEADTESEGSCSIFFGSKSGSGFSPLNNFNFKLNKGVKNRYLIRVSSDFYWYSGQINAFTLKSDIPLQNCSIKLLEGD